MMFRDWWMFVSGSANVFYRFSIFIKSFKDYHYENDQIFNDTGVLLCIDR
jgi:hypothetical protein